MGRVSDHPFGTEALIASLEGDERIEALRAALDAAEETALANIAKLMMVSGKPVDQRKIDYTRGYYAGAKYWLGGRMTTAQKRLALEVTAEPEEDEA